MSIFPPARSSFAVAFPHRHALARRRPATFSSIAEALRLGPAIDHLTHRVFSAQDADRSLRRANVARASPDLCSLTRVPALPFALRAPRTFAGTLRLPHSTPPGSPSKS